MRRDAGPTSPGNRLRGEKDRVLMQAQHGSRFAFEEDADESLWAMRDYFWTLRVGILDDPGPGTWRSFSGGYEHSRLRVESGHPPGHPRRRAA